MKAYGPGLKKDGVLPGKPANFMVDSTTTGPAPITVDVTGKTLLLCKRYQLACCHYPFFMINEASPVKLSLHFNEEKKH